MRDQGRTEGGTDRHRASHGWPSAGSSHRSIADRAQTTTDTLRSFFNRGQSPPLRRELADGLSQLDWTANRPERGQRLAGRVIGYEVPAAVSGLPVSPVYASTLLACIRAVEEYGGWLAPFTVDPHTPLYQPDATRPGTEDWLLRYAHGYGPTRYRRVARERGVDAFLVDGPVSGDPRLAALDEIGVAYVVLGSPERPDQRFFVDVDDAAGFTLMVERLLAAGCEPDRVAHYGFSEDATTVPGRRRDAVAAALGRPVGAVPRHTRHVAATDDEAEVARLTTWLREHRPHAVVCDCDAMAALVLRAADRAGQRVAPSRQTATDVLLAGCDDAPVRRAARTPWMSLRHPSQAWASAAAELLADAIRGRRPRHVLLSPILVAPPPVASTAAARRPPLPRGGPRP